MLDLYLKEIGGPLVDTCLWYSLVFSACFAVVIVKANISTGEAVGSLFSLLSPGFRNIVTKLDQTEADLYLQQKFITSGHLVAGVAHEVKNILAHVKLCLEYGLSKKETEAKNRALETALDNVVAGSASVTSMLETITRSGREQPLPVRLRESLDVFARSVRAGYRIDGIQFELIVDLNPVVRLRKGEFEQALLNLIRNSADAFRTAQSDQTKVGKKKLIRLAVYASGKSVIADLVDNAGGIPLNIQANIFEPPSDRDAVGLGLYLAHRAILQNGGELEYHPTGDGSCFRLIFTAFDNGLR